MSFSLKPDYEESRKRYEAFWHQEIMDRPPVSIALRASNPKPVPQNHYETHEERWLDVDFRAEQLAVEVANYELHADALPVVWPNLGPEIFSAWCGCPQVRRGYNVERALHRGLGDRRGVRCSIRSTRCSRRLFDSPNGSWISEKVTSL